MFRTLVHGALLSVAFAPSADAVTFTEIEDAGDTIGTAQFVGFNVTTIRGDNVSIGAEPGDLGDVFLLVLPQIAQVEITVTEALVLGNNLWLTDSIGQPVASSPAAFVVPERTGPSQIVLNPVTQGFYFLYTNDAFGEPLVDREGNVWFPDRAPPPEFGLALGFDERPDAIRPVGDYAIEIVSRPFRLSFDALDRFPPVRLTPEVPFAFEIPVEIPLPASGLVLLAGLAGLGLLSRPR